MIYVNFPCPVLMDSNRIIMKQKNMLILLGGMQNRDYSFII